MKKILLVTLMLLALNGCSELEQALTELEQTLPEETSSQSLTYSDIRPVFWGQLYSNGGNTLYCDQAFGKRHGRNINIEHIFPMSWVTKSLKCGTRNQCRDNSNRFNRIEADLHNLYPALAEINDMRGAMSFAIIKGEKHARAGCDFEADKRSYKAEPRPAVRGDIARAMLYMADTYAELTLFKSQRKLMEKWHREDPPDSEEKRRNRLIESIQGNRNRYID